MRLPSVVQAGQVIGGDISSGRYDVSILGETYSQASAAAVKPFSGSDVLGVMVGRNFVIVGVGGYHTARETT